jgi:hypothetical protein
MTFIGLSLLTYLTSLQYSSYYVDTTIVGEFLPEVSELDRNGVTELLRNRVSELDRNRLTELAGFI